MIISIRLFLLLIVYRHIPPRHRLTRRYRQTERLPARRPSPHRVVLHAFRHRHDVRRPDRLRRQPRSRPRSTHLDRYGRLWERGVQFQAVSSLLSFPCSRRDMGGEKK